MGNSTNIYLNNHVSKSKKNTKYFQPYQLNKIWKRFKFDVTKVDLRLLLLLLRDVPPPCPVSPDTGHISIDFSNVLDSFASLALLALWTPLTLLRCCTGLESPDPKAGFTINIGAPGQCLCPGGRFPSLFPLVTDDYGPERRALVCDH